MDYGVSTMHYPYAFAALLLLVFASGLAEARPDARAMTCEQARSLIEERGAVAMTTGRHTYQRFVAHRGYCLYSQRAGSVWTPTRDQAECRLKICIDPPITKRRGRR